MHVTCEIEVEAQHDVLTDDVEFVARGDLWLVGTSTLHEYDGGDHLEKRQQRKDLKRSTRLGHSDWIRRGYTSQDVIGQAIVILRDADESLGRASPEARARLESTAEGVPVHASGDRDVPSAFGLVPAECRVGRLNPAQTEHQVCTRRTLRRGRRRGPDLRGR